LPSDLFAAVIDAEGWSKPLRYVVARDAHGEESEWATPPTKRAGWERPEDCEAEAA